MEQKLELRKTYLGTVRKKMFFLFVCFDLQKSLPGREALDLGRKRCYETA